LPRSQTPLPLEWALWNRDTPVPFGQTTLTVSDYMQRHAITALLVAQGTRVLVEAYAHGASERSLFLSNSVAKSFTGLTVGSVLASRSDDLALRPLSETVPALRGRPAGEVTAANYMRMSSGLRYTETNQPGDDHWRFGRTIRSTSILRALQDLQETAYTPGSRFSYAGSSTAALSLFVRGITRKSLAETFSEAIWNRVGMEAEAFWQRDVAGETLGHCCFFARPRDYLRLAIVLGHNGIRPSDGEPIVPQAFLDRTRTPAASDPPFRPRPGSWGYANQFWVMGSARRQIAMLGLRGQSIFIDPDLRLVMVQFSAASEPSAGQTQLGRDREALWNGLVRQVSATP
jgi:CubicO group peptidase (beta-lactamase class C family)